MAPAMRDLKAKPRRAQPRHYHSHHHHHHHHHLDKLKMHCRWWLLWVALSVYLFLSVFPSPPPSSAFLRRKPPVSAAAAPRVRIYVYDLPPRFNRGWVAADARCARHLFAAEVAVHEALLARASAARPEEADLFFVPVYVSCNFSTPTDLPSLAHARGLLADAVSLFSAGMPYWNRSAGTDHVLVAAHDFGACFHPNFACSLACLLGRERYWS